MAQACPSGASCGTNVASVTVGDILSVNVTAATSLTPVEQQHALYLREEEKLARDVYRGDRTEFEVSAPVEDGEG